MSFGYSSARTPGLCSDWEKAAESAAAGGQRTKPVSETGLTGVVLSVAPFDRRRNAFIDRGTFSTAASRLLSFRQCLPEPECGG